MLFAMSTSLLSGRETAPISVLMMATIIKRVPYAMGLRACVLLSANDHWRYLIVMYVAIIGF